MGRSRSKPPDTRRVPVRGHAARARKDHSQELAQDYVEMIAELIAETGEARLIDLARGLGVTHVTAGRTLQRLQRQGLVTSQPADRSSDERRTQSRHGSRTKPLPGLTRRRWRGRESTPASTSREPRDARRVVRHLERLG
jgi:hypothetical protein